MYLLQAVLQLTFSIVNNVIMTCIIQNTNCFEKTKLITNTTINKNIKKVNRFSFSFDYKKWRNIKKYICNEISINYISIYSLIKMFRFYFVLYKKNYTYYKYITYCFFFLFSIHN